MAMKASGPAPSLRIVQMCFVLSAVGEGGGEGAERLMYRRTTAPKVWEKTSATV